MTSEITEGNWLTSFLDKIWVQLGMATGITVLWLLWIIFEIIIRDPPA